MRDDATPHAADDVRELTGGGLTVWAADAWGAIPARAATLVDDPELITLACAVVRDGPPPDLAASVHTALADALAQSSSPTIVGECLTVLLESSSALEHLGERLYDTCLERARPPAFDAEPRTWLLAADALEAATRLALGDWAPHFALLAQLVRLPPIAPPSFVRAALRCLAASYERWREPALVAALERLAGVAPAAATAVPVDAATAEEWAHDVAPDAAYELGCASLLQALGMETLPEAEEHLQAAQRRLAIAATDRDDAAILTDVVGLLIAHLPTDAGHAARASTDLAALADRIERRVREHVIGYAQLGHWRAPRLDAEVAWAQLAHDVARSSAALAQASWYHAEEMLADVLAVYTASRCSRVLRREDQGGVRAILGPTIESGIAVQAGLMKHLEDHIEALKAADDVDRRPGGADYRAAVPRDLDRTAELDAARALLLEARAQLAALDRRPKQRGSAASVSPDDLTALPLLNQLLRGDVAALSALPPEIGQRLEAAIAARHERDGGNLSAPDALVVDETLARLQRELASSPYYGDGVKAAVDEVLTLLLRFWRSREGLGPAYLFDPAAVEEDLAADLKLWFDGTAHAGRTGTEIRHVGGGRVDIACVFPLFRLYIELKKDDRHVNVAEMKRYLLQTAGYQSADVPIGFLAVLDLRRRTGPTPHLSSCFGMVVLDDPDLGKPRFVVTMVVPGNRTKPSSMH